ncbi:MAG: amidase domain-containing protein [Gordonia sp. (in: high G+C Gram-positive bacteria)]
MAVPETTGAAALSDSSNLSYTQIPAIGDNLDPSGNNPLDPGPPMPPSLSVSPPGANIQLVDNGSEKDVEPSYENLSPNRRAAIEYAEKYADENNKEYDYYGRGDCTNFVSQALKAGGFEEDRPEFWDFRGGDPEDWYYDREKNLSKDSSDTWSVAKDNHNFMTQKTDRAEILSVVPLDRDVDQLDPLAATNAGLVPGDLIYYKNSSGTINHVGIYVGVKEIDGKKVDVINQHSARTNKWDDWRPTPGGSYNSGVAQAEFVHVKYPGE